MLNVSSQPLPPTFFDVLVLRLTGNYISVPGFVTVLFDVPLVL